MGDSCAFAPGSGAWSMSVNTISTLWYSEAVPVRRQSPLELEYGRSRVLPLQAVDRGR
jgi:hypothetical protein